MTGPATGRNGGRLAWALALGVLSSPFNAGVAQAKPLVIEENEEEQTEAPEFRGVLIGEFFFRGIRGAEGIKTRLSFSLYASVLADHEDGFRDLLETRRHRVREQVITAIRLTETGDLQEPSLGRLKRRILMRLRRTSPSLKIEELHFREFTLIFN